MEYPTQPTLIYMPLGHKSDTLRSVRGWLAQLGAWWLRLAAPAPHVDPALLAPEERHTLRRGALLAWLTLGIVAAAAVVTVGELPDPALSDFAAIALVVALSCARSRYTPPQGLLQHSARIYAYTVRGREPPPATRNTAHTGAVLDRTGCASDASHTRPAYDFVGGGQDRLATLGYGPLGRTVDAPAIMAAQLMQVEQDGQA